MYVITMLWNPNHVSRDWYKAVCIILARVFIVVIMYVIMYPEGKKGQSRFIVIKYVVMWPILYDVIMYWPREPKNCNVIM